MTDVVACKVCRAIVLTKDPFGTWMSRHHQRTVRIKPEGRVTLEIDCAHQHRSAYVIDKDGITPVG